MKLIKFGTPAPAGLRRSPVFVGEDRLDQPVVHYIAPPWGQVSAKLRKQFPILEDDALSREIAGIVLAGLAWPVPATTQDEP
ncbi:hypothetical protein [Bordetella genomosp. 13]|uniref:hypothetical protein n=1 Tax=Bordetella genomosp. 13 TaxID=463040 RepID=UPI0011A920D0|nr:hypothetical protein [Bordetella genomosp. 13]